MTTWAHAGSPIDLALAFPSHHESIAIVRAPVTRVFAHLDDHAQLSSHMSQSSWRMGGGRMNTQLDEGLGQRVGSRIRLAGKILGVNLSVEEIVTEHMPPQKKVWQTMGSPKLNVMGGYRMGFELSPEGECLEASSLHRLLAAREGLGPLVGPALWQVLRQLVHAGNGGWCCQAFCVTGCGVRAPFIQ